MQTLAARLCLLLVLAGCFPAVPAGNADPEQLMRNATNDILTRLDASPQLTKNRAELIQLIEQEIFPLVDFRHAARLTLGHYWKDAGDTQRKRFISELRGLLACTYSTTFSNYAGHCALDDLAAQPDGNAVLDPVRHPCQRAGFAAGGGRCVADGQSG